MFKHTTKHYIIGLLFLYTNFQFAQNNLEFETFLNINDKKIKLLNLPINNGPIHKNYDLTINKENHRYWITNDFITGKLVYNSDLFVNLSLKYDIYEDEIVYLPDPENSLIKINLIKNNINSFEINNSKFINLSSKLSDKFKKGYYELKFSTKKGTLYIKHIKDRKEIINENKNLIQYLYRKEYVLYSSELYYEIKSKKDIINIYPLQKNIINKFYSDYEKLEEANKDLFLINLLKQISQ